MQKFSAFESSDAIDALLGIRVAIVGSEFAFVCIDAISVIVFLITDLALFTRDAVIVPGEAFFLFATERA